MALRQRVRKTILFLILLTFPITLNYFSVVLIMQSASEGVANFSLFFWSAFTVTSLVIGRLACAYICPLGAVQETLASMAPQRLKGWKYLKVIRWVLLVAWVGTIVALAISAGGYKRVNLLYEMPAGISVDSLQTLIVYYTVVLVPFLPALFMGKRAFCRHFCPWSLLNTLGTRLKNWGGWPSLSLHAEPARCVNCKICSRECPMSLDVNSLVQRGKMDHDECILCGTCVDTCKKEVIHYTWQRPRAQ